MRVSTFFWIISFFLILILVAIVLSPQAEATEPCHHCPMLDVQQEWIDHYVENPITKSWTEKSTVSKFMQDPVIFKMTIYKDVEALHPVTLKVVAEYADMPFIDGGCANASGCWVAKTQTIWIVEKAMSWGSRTGSGIGCSTLYHEILHSYGFDHGYMEFHFPDSRCAVPR